MHTNKKKQGRATHQRKHKHNQRNKADTTNTKKQHTPQTIDRESQASARTYVNMKQELGKCNNKQEDATHINEEQEHTTSNSQKKTRNATKSNIHPEAAGRCNKKPADARHHSKKLEYQSAIYNTTTRNSKLKQEDAMHNPTQEADTNRRNRCKKHRASKQTKTPTTATLILNAKCTMQHQHNSARACGKPALAAAWCIGDEHKT